MFCLSNINEQLAILFIFSFIRNCKLSIFIDELLTFDFDNRISYFKIWTIDMRFTIFVNIIKISRARVFKMNAIVF